MFNVASCTSQNSTAIISSTVVEGGRAIDRHNPIITDRNRSGISTKPDTKNTKKSTSVRTTFVGERNHNENYNNENDRKAVQTGRKSFCKTSEFIAKAVACNTSKAGVDYVTPTSHTITTAESSSRYLLDETSLFDETPDIEPVLKMEPSSNNISSVKFDGFSNTHIKQHCSSDEVVILRVSLHCRGCERKLKKHLSRMSGVTSFDIDFAAKKVTVVGNVTPVQVLSSITKVKTAKLWSTTSSHISTRNTAQNNRLRN